MDKVCRWCKHYKNDCCNKAEDNFIIDECEEVTFVIREPESFCCRDWE